MYMVTTSFMKILNFFEIFKFCENFQILNFKIFIFFILKFSNFFKNFKILWNFMKTEIFKNFEILKKKFRVSR
jgi:hypothetical protein